MKCVVSVSEEVDLNDLVKLVVSTIGQLQDLWSSWHRVTKAATSF